MERQEKIPQEDEGSAMTMKPDLSPELPVADRMLLALLYRLTVDARKMRDVPGRIKAEKALAAATAIAADIPYRPSP
jgi:hypothetical protein